MLRKMLFTVTVLAGTFSAAAAQDRGRQRDRYLPPERRDEAPKKWYDPDHQGRYDRGRDDWRWDTGSNQLARGDQRGTWHYAVDNGGRFQDLGRGVWVQYRRGQSEILFEEVRRTREFVELLDRSRNLPVRIYDQKLHQYRDGLGWVPMFDGYWD